MNVLKTNNPQAMGKEGRAALLAEDERLLQKVQWWFFDDADFEASIKAWVSDNCDSFDDSPEHKLE